MVNAWKGRFKSFVKESGRKNMSFSWNLILQVVDLSFKGSLINGCKYQM